MARQKEYVITGTPKAAPVHPGEILREDMLPALGLSMTEAARAEFFAQEPALDTAIRECGAEWLAVELRMAAAGRDGTHIGHGLDAVRLQQIDEGIDRVARMSDREQRMLAHGSPGAVACVPKRRRGALFGYSLNM